MSERRAMAAEPRLVYNVHMKRVTASEARRNWFRLLDEVASGQVVVVERNGRRILIQRQPSVGKVKAQDYGAVLRGDTEHADAWSWSWQSPGVLRPRKRRGR